MRIWSLRFRLALIYGLLIALAVGALGVQIYRWSADDLLSERRVRLLTEARMAADAVASHIEDSAMTARTLEDYGRRFGTRLVFIDQDQTITADSLQFSSEERSLVGQSLASSEAQAALEGRESAEVYRLPDEGFVLYAAAPVVRGGELRGAVVIASSLAAIIETLNQLVGRLLVAGALVVAVVLAVTWVVAIRLTAPLYQLIHASGKLGEGVLSTRTHIRTRDEFRELGDTFNRMADQIESHDIKQRQFIADASHELRSPVSSALLLLEGMRKKAELTTDPLLTALEEQLARMSRLINQLLELAQLDDWTSEPAGDEADAYIDVTHVIHRIERRFAPVASARDLTLEVEISERIIIRGVEDHLERILQNLVENAIKYSSAGDYVQIAAKDQGDQIVLSVLDTGKGIEAAHVPYVFDRFYRADRARSREHGSFGLGLAIVKRRVDALRGSIFISSEVGKGTRFDIKLPKNTM